MRNQKKSCVNASCAETARLKALARKLLAAIEALDEEHLSKIDFPVDFYEQVTRFEIELITRALTQSHGHQLEGARLLNLNPTTLNAKIKQYNIQVNAFSNGVEAPKNGKGSVISRLLRVER